MPIDTQAARNQAVADYKRGLALPADNDPDRSAQAIGRLELDKILRTQPGSR